MELGRITRIAVRPRGGKYRLEVQRNTPYGPMTITKVGSEVQATLRDIEVEHGKRVAERRDMEAQIAVNAERRTGQPVG